jgi:DNA-binding MarR family transcriptional regulator
MALTEGGWHDLDGWAGLVRRHVALRNALDAHLRREHGLTVNQYAALLLIGRAPDRRRRHVDVARALQLTPSGVTRLLDSLQHDGLVEGRGSTRDARVKYVALTEAGQTALKHATARLQPIWSQLQAL